MSNILTQGNEQKHPQVREERRGALRKAKAEINFLSPDGTALNASC